MRVVAFEAELELGPDTDSRAPGGAVTVALCGSWDHEGPCRWPHHNKIDTASVPVRLRTVALVDHDSIHEVGRRIDAGLRADHRWLVLSCRITDLTNEEHALARRLVADRAGRCSSVETCPGRVIEHADGTFAGCTLGDACRQHALPHEGDPIRCWVWSREGCDYCGARHQEPPLVSGGSRSS